MPRGSGSYDIFAVSPAQAKKIDLMLGRKKKGKKHKKHHKKRHH